MTPERLISSVLVCLAAAGSGSPALGQSKPAGARLQFTIRDKATQQPVACRVHLYDADSKPVLPQQHPHWHDQFVCDGSATLQLPPGTYSYEIERGPEYLPVRDRIDLKGSREMSVAIERITDLARQGWWSGELHVHRTPRDMELLMAAEDLHVAPSISWWYGEKRTSIIPSGEPLRRFPQDRWNYVKAGEDERGGGSLLFFHMDDPLSIKNATEEYPPMIESILGARRQPGAFVDIEKPFWWDLPIWLALARPDTIGIAHNHMNRSGMLDEEAWGKKRDLKQYPSPRGNGFWTQEIYYRILNCGFRLAPSAGSASGVLKNPVGYNRVYVHLGPRFDYEKWWEGLRAGRSFVTNGPLLRCRANGELPGHIFRTPAGQKLDIRIEAELDSSSPISSIEIVQNGEVKQRVPWDRSSHGRTVANLSFDTSGWFLVRTIADVPNTFRFASSAPWYVEIGNVGFVSHSSVQFFLDWLAERRGQIHEPDASHQSRILQYHDAALQYWKKLHEAATAP